MHSTCVIIHHFSTEVTWLIAAMMSCMSVRSYSNTTVTCSSFPLPSLPPRGSKSLEQCTDTHTHTHQNSEGNHLQIAYRRWKKVPTCFIEKTLAKHTQTHTQPHSHPATHTPYHVRVAQERESIFIHRVDCTIKMHERDCHRANLMNSMNSNWNDERCCV